PRCLVAITLHGRSFHQLFFPCVISSITALVITPEPTSSTPPRYMSKRILLPTASMLVIPVKSTDRHSVCGPMAQTSCQHFFSSSAEDSVSEPSTPRRVSPWP